MAEMRVDFSLDELKKSWAEDNVRGLCQRKMSAGIHDNLFERMVTEMAEVVKKALLTPEDQRPSGTSRLSLYVKLPDPAKVQAVAWEHEVRV